jgi:hypothetical protein
VQTASFKNVGPPSVPREIRQLRQQSLDYHTRLGQPFIVKRRLTLEDVEAGLAQRCPYDQNAAYNQGDPDDPYCFGTGILGGFADGIVQFLVLSDTEQDMFQLSDAGMLVRSSDPTCTAPWTPLLHDGDLIIAADFDPNNFTILAMHERYELNQVSPVAPRGGAPLGFATHRNRGNLDFQNRGDMIVAQNFRVNRLPPGHPLYDVPVDFQDTNPVLPNPPPVPPGGDPDDYPTPKVAFASIGLRAIGDSIAGPGGGGDEDVDVIFVPED